MKNSFYDGPFSKIFRTLGFLLVLLGSSFYLAKTLIHPDHASLMVITLITQYGQMIDDQLANLSFLNSGYALIALVVGFIFLMIALRRGIVLKIVLAAALLIGLLMTANEGIGLFAPVAVVFDPAILNILGFGDMVLDPLLATSPYAAPAVYIAAAFLIWSLFAHKRPKRISSFFMRVGATTLFLAMLLTLAPSFLNMPLMDLEIYVVGIIAFYSLAYAAFTAGSLLGIIGFFRR